MRISKYNPRYRKKGKYLRDEWTAVSDIGRTFADGRLTFKTYLDWEDRYIDVILYACKEVHLTHLTVEGLEIDDVHDYPNFFQSLKNGQVLNLDEIALISRYILREMLWAKLISEDLQISFGYDYYFYLNSKRELKETEQYLLKKGLFSENKKFPHL